MLNNALIASFFAILLVVTPGYAEEVDAKAYTKYREFLMESARAQRKNIYAILNKKVSEKGNLVRHARILHELSMMFSGAFPEGSNYRNTRASEFVWLDNEIFQDEIKKFQQVTAAFVKLTSKTDDLAVVRKAMMQVTGSCKDCHTRFRSRD